jgi:uncharacterized membrane protein (UPF0136 family)
MVSKKDTGYFQKNEKNNLSSGAYHNNYFAISKKLLKTLEKVM